MASKRKRRVYQDLILANLAEQKAIEEEELADGAAEERGAAVLIMAHSILEAGEVDLLAGDSDSELTLELTDLMMQASVLILAAVDNKEAAARARAMRFRRFASRMRNAALCEHRWLTRKLLDPFDYPDDVFVGFFRFTKDEVRQTCRAIGLQGEIVTPCRTKFTAEYAMCVLLRRLVHVGRWVYDLEEQWGCSRRRLQTAYRYVETFLYNKYYGPLLQTIDTRRVQPRLAEFAAAIRNRGAPLNDVWGFIDGTKLRVARPVRGQRACYNYKRYHSWSFQGISTPDGIIAHLSHGCPGSRNDNHLLAQSGILHMLPLQLAGNSYDVFGDCAYATRLGVTSGFRKPRGGQLPQIQAAWNFWMSHVRISVEWTFGIVVNTFPALMFKKNNMLLKTRPVRRYIVAVLLVNMLTCLRRGNAVTKYFDRPATPCAPPSLEEYLRTAHLPDPVAAVGGAAAAAAAAGGPAAGAL